MQDAAFEYIILDTGYEFGDRQAIENFKKHKKYGNGS